MSELNINWINMDHQVFEETYKMVLAPNSPQHVFELVQKIDIKASSFSSNLQEMNQENNALGEICKWIVQWPIQALWISKPSLIHILADLNHIKFSNLIRIDISQNSVQSLYLLGSFDFPKLKEMYLQTNYFCNSRACERWSFPMLEFVGLGDNPINSINGLKFSDLPALKWLGIDHTNSAKWVPQIRVIMKINAPLLNYLQLENTLRWKWPAFDEVFKRKFIGANIGR